MTRNYTNVHDPAACAGRACCIHNPSDHPLNAAPLNWREDRGLMERICEHGVGHPDKNHLDYVRRERGDNAAYGEAIHGCDGCC